MPVQQPIPPPTDKQQDAIREFVRKPGGELPIGRVDGKIVSALNAVTDQALLSADTMRKQLREHGELTEADYLLVPLALAEPTVIAARETGRVVLLRAGSKVLRVAVKTTRQANRLYVVSVHYCDLPAARRFLEKATVLFGKAADLQGS